MPAKASRWRPLTVLTAVAAAVLVGGVVALSLADGHHHDDQVRLDTTSGLLVSSRSALRLCVQADLDPRTPAADRARADLLAGLDQARRHPHWSDAYGAVRQPDATAFDFGCPVSQPPAPHEPRTTVAGPTGDPGPYRVWVYLLDGPTADRLLGAEQDSAVSTAEFMRDGTTLFPVSSALMIRQSRLADAAAVGKGLQAALGLD